MPGRRKCRHIGRGLGAPGVGLEPTTQRLTVERSAIELPGPGPRGERPGATRCTRGALEARSAASGRRELLGRAPRRVRPRRPRLATRGLRRSPGHRLGQRARAASRNAARAETARQPHADAGPVDARGVLVHVAGGGQRRRRRSRSPAPARRVPWPPWQTTRSQAGIVARVGQPVDQPARWPAPAAGRVERAAVRRGQHADGQVGEARRARRAAAGARGPATSTARRARAGRRPGGRRDVVGRRLPQQRADDVASRPASARGYSSCGNVATRHELRLNPAVDAVERRQAEPPARLVELVAAALEAAARRARSSAAPERAPGRACAAAARPSEYGGQPGAAARVDVGDERRRPARPRARPASAGASVRMSATTTSGRSSRDERRRVARSPARPPRRASAGARAWGRRGTRAPARTRIPRASTSAAPARPRLQRRRRGRARRSARPSAIIGNAWPGVAERAEQQTRIARAPTPSARRARRAGAAARGAPSLRRTPSG